MIANFLGCFARLLLVDVRDVVLVVLRCDEKLASLDIELLRFLGGGMVILSFCLLVSTESASMISSCALVRVTIPESPWGEDNSAG